MVTEKDTLNFTKGACWILAQEIALMTGWKVVGFHDIPHGYLAKHVFIETPDGMYLDIEGKHTGDEMLERWECEKGKYKITRLKSNKFLGLPTGMGDAEQYRVRARELAPGLIVEYMSKLVRDENNAPVRELRNRDSRGRFCRPYYAYLWEDWEK